MYTTTYTITANGNYPSTGIQVQSTCMGIKLTGTFGGATVTVQSSEDGSSFQSIEDASGVTGYTAGTVKVAYFPIGTRVRLVVSGATGTTNIAAAITQ